MTDKLLSKEWLAEIGSAELATIENIDALLSHIRAQAELLTAAETALAWALPLAIHGRVIDQMAESARATLTRIREAHE